MVKNSHDSEKLGGKKFTPEFLDVNSITTHTGLLPIETSLLYTVLKALATFVVQRTMYKISGTISDFTKNGVN